MLNYHLSLRVRSVRGAARDTRRRRRHPRAVTRRVSSPRAPVGVAVTNVTMHVPKGKVRFLSFMFYNANDVAQRPSQVN